MGVSAGTDLIRSRHLDATPRPATYNTLQELTKYGKRGAGIKMRFPNAKV